MKFIIANDIHCSGRNSENRIGNYYQDIMTKIKETIKIAKSKKVDKILCGGDLYDSDTVQNTMSDELALLVEESKIIWEVLPGNHCEVNNNWEVSNSSTLASFFRRSKYINKLEIIETKDTIVQGFLYFHNIEGFVRENGLKCSNPDKKNRIAIVHGLITEKPLPHSALHICYKEIKTNFNYVIIAHNHKPFIAENNGVQYINPGCIGRRKKDERNIEPTVLFLDTDTMKFEHIKLKNVRPISECFDLEKIGIKNEWDGEMNNFITSLESTKTKGIDIRGEVENVGKEKNIEKIVIKIITDEISKFEGDEE